MARLHAEAKLDPRLAVGAIGKDLEGEEGLNVVGSLAHGAMEADGRQEKEEDVVVPQMDGVEDEGVDGVGEGGEKSGSAGKSGEDSEDFSDLDEEFLEQMKARQRCVFGVLFDDGWMGNVLDCCYLLCAAKRRALMTCRWILTSCPFAKVAA